MLINSFEYFIFLPLAVLAYFSAPARIRVWVLASDVFYMFWRWGYVVLIIAQTEIN